MTEGIHEDRTMKALELLNNQPLVDKLLSVGLNEEEIKKLIDIGPLTFAKKKRPVVLLNIDGGKVKLVSIKKDYVEIRATGIDEENPSVKKLAKIYHETFIESDISRV